ncbi:MAG: N-acetylglucosamine-6-phosphate deacetylase [Acidobacteria bacterium]|nr:N-acetylglucosamine-6-phosphate deacetylase [Acidobacteriota bacterium]
MPLLALTARKLFTPLEAVDDAVILIDDGVIRAVSSRKVVTMPPGARLVDLGDKILAPGFIDIHIHGGAGRDLMEGTREAVEAVARSVLEHGTTSFVPTTLSSPPEVLRKSLAGLHSVLTSWKAEPREVMATPVGIHLEGPFLSADCRGAHPRADLQKPSVALFEQFLDAAGGTVRILTLAPELQGATELQQYAIEKGVGVALGHSNATYEEAVKAIDAGAAHAVHVFNAMRPFAHRDPGILGAVLTDDRVKAEVIADGVHVDPAALRLLVRAKGVSRTVLVTDAVSATGMCPGQYFLGGMEIILGDDSRTGLPTCRNREGALAGSVLTQDRAVRNIMEMAGVTLQDAVRMASYNPARLLGLEQRKGWLREGADADLVVLDPNGSVAGTMVSGQANFL